MSVVNQLLIQPQGLGEVFLAARNVSGPASYPTGGVTISPSIFGMLSIKILLSDHLSPDGTYFARFVGANNDALGNTSSNPVKMKWFVTATGAEVGNGVNLSTESIRVLAIGN